MLHVDKMDMAGRVLLAATRDLTDEEIGRMLIVHVPGACNWITEAHDGFVKKEKERKEMSKVDETVQEMLDVLKNEEASYEDKLIGVKVAFMFGEAGADAEQLKILTEAKMKILAGLEEQKKGGE